MSFWDRDDLPECLMYISGAVVACVVAICMAVTMPKDSDEAGIHLRAGVKIESEGR